jgi:hypothetical protein
MKFSKLLAVTLIGLCSSAALYAAVDAGQAARLGKDLTPIGAERAGNADGSIPAWSGKPTPVPASYKPGGGFPSPYPDDKPLFSVNADNAAQYKELLTEGAAALLERYGKDGFRLDVYPTYRNIVHPQWFHQGTLENATKVTLSDGGQKVNGNVPGVPFPIPQSGLEVLWNHMVRFTGFQVKYRYNSYYVDSSGKPVLSTTAEGYVDYPMFMAHFKPEQKYNTEDLRWGLLRINYLAPPRRAGEILLVHEPGADYTAGKGRDAWQYLTGQRRVRKAPAVSFDTPNPGTAGTSTYDDAYVYNGSPERYDWTLVGKAEKIVPYNNNAFVFEHKVEDMLGKHFFKPEYVRWEKHRVWIVEGTLKSGTRHIYAKRRYYIDEDSWIAVTGETWDGKGNLWRVHLAYPYVDYSIPTLGSLAYGSYDLLSGVYNINTKPIPGTYSSEHGESLQYFSSQGMARTGVR